MLPTFILGIFSSSCSDIEITVDVTHGVTLEDALLITSVDGASPRNVIILGDLDLSVEKHTLDMAVSKSKTLSRCHIMILMEVWLG